MNQTIFFAGTTPAARFAARSLEKWGTHLTNIPEEADLVLLDVPSFDAKGNLRSGCDPLSLISRLPPHCRILGGNLRHPALDGRQILDLLQEESYLRQNALITAHCALEIAAGELPVILPQAPALVIGWGRIGKALSRLLRALDVPVTVTARSLGDRALMAALGYDGALLEEVNLEDYRLIFNTVPAPMLTREALSLPRNPVKIDLASTRGLEGTDVIHARGLPGLRAPESSGELIARTIQSLLQEDVS